MVGGVYGVKGMNICVVGLGYVGLPLAVEFAKAGLKVFGYDINKRRIEDLKQGVDKTDQVSKEDLKNVDIHYTTSIEECKEANIFIIAVPTPVKKSKEPDLEPIRSAGRDIARVIKNGDVVILESTVYPGTTEEILGKEIEKHSGLKAKIDFKLAYSPERINPGDKKHTLKTITKVVGGQDKETAEFVKKLYSKIVDSVFVAKDIKTAEASKLLENVQRSVNIGLMNEMAVLFDKIGIDIWDVIEAASTKWNFLKFYPGLVGGHCIPVDPYYLIYKALEYDFYPHTVAASRIISDNMHIYLLNKIIRELNNYGKTLKGLRVLFLGATYKENIPDTRNSMALKLLDELKKWQANITVVDPYVKDFLNEIPEGTYDITILAVPHKEFMDKKEELIEKTTLFIVDVKNVLKTDKKRILRL